MNDHVRGVAALWNDAGATASVARAALAPVTLAFRAASAVRGALYDAGVLPVRDAGLPCVSVGNLTVGGTGKTPFAAWLAGGLAAHVRVAVVLRGYGGDEGAVHRRLNPAVPVVENADRLAGARAARSAGAQVAVLDDAFQHRRLARAADIVLVSVEQLLRPRRLLPAGPWREPLSSARRADLIVLTRKSASSSDAERSRAVVARALEGVAMARVLLAPRQLERVDAPGSMALDALRGADVTAVAGVGEPVLFQRQLEGLGARVTLAAFTDHHAFTTRDVQRVIDAASADALVVCTLKDATKLAPLWPASRALWYVSQQLVVEQGAELLDRLCARVLERAIPATAG